MIELRTLEGERDGALYDAFMEAFADYSAPVTMTPEDFRANNRRRGFDPSISLGAYDSDRLVGFVMNGRGDWRGAETAYDLGTGILPSHRGTGLGTRLAGEAKALLARRGIGVWLLEVIRTNEAAVRTYRKAGFSVTREFECPGGTFLDPGTPCPEGVRVLQAPSFPASAAASLRDFEPSWQNSDQAIERGAGMAVALGAYEGGSLVGYAVASPSGSVWQLAVARGSRRRGIGTALLRAVAQRSGGGVRYVNVDSRDAATMGLFAKAGLVSDIGQYEMEAPIGPS